VYARPTVAFSADPTNGVAPLVVTFTNNSNTNGTPVTEWRWTVRSGLNISTNDPVFSYTYTNAPSTNTVILRATTPAGSVSATNRNYIIVTT
jgi:PKD repeat protein